MEQTMQYLVEKAITQSYINMGLAAFCIFLFLVDIGLNKRVNDIMKKNNLK